MVAGERPGDDLALPVLQELFDLIVSSDRSASLLLTWL